MIQLELPFFTRSTADDPQPEQDRTHPAQMIIQHCGKAREHVSHAGTEPMPWGCPGTPDLREARMNCDKETAHAPHGWKRSGHACACEGAVPEHCHAWPGKHAPHLWYGPRRGAGVRGWCDGSDAEVTYGIHVHRRFVGRDIEDVELP